MTDEYNTEEIFEPAYDLLGLAYDSAWDIENEDFRDNLLSALDR